MLVRTTALTVLSVWVALPPLAVAQVYNSADYVRGMYHRYLAREPSANELTQWVWSFQKGLPAVEAQVTFLASDEYFQRHARNPDRFIAGLFNEVLSRAPSASESTQWARHLQQLGGDRGSLVRVFLTQSRQQASRPADLPVAGGPPSESPSGPSAEGALAVDARLLRDALGHELGGTPQGRQAQVMAGNLVNAVRELERTTGGETTGAPRALEDARRALAALQTEMVPLRSSAPVTMAYLTRLSKQLEPPPVPGSELVPLPTPAAATESGMDSQRYDDLLLASTGLSADTQQILFQLRNMLSRDAYHNQLLRDLEWFHAQADAFHRSLRVGLPLPEARARVARMRSAAEGVSQSIRQGNPAGRILQRWDGAARELQQISALVGASSGPAIDPGQPVLIHAPTYARMPYQVRRPVPARNLDQVTPTIDQAVGHLNAFVVRLGRFVSQSPRVPALQAEARGLRLTLIQLREGVMEGMPARQIDTSLAEIDRALRTLRAQRQEAATLSRLGNFPDLSDVERSLEQLNQIFTPTRSFTG